MAITLYTNFEDQPLGQLARPMNGGEWGHNFSGQPNKNVFSNVINRFARAGSRCLANRVESNFTTGVYRAELAGDSPENDGVAKANAQLDVGDEIWLGFSLLCPPEIDVSAGTEDAEVIFQSHCNIPANFQLSPGVGFTVNRGRVVMDHRFTSVDAGEASTQTVVSNNVDLGPIIKGYWMDFVVHLVFQHSVAGVTEVWRDKTLRYRNLTDPNTNNISAVYKRYFKFGSYNPGWRDGFPPVAGSPRAIREWCLDEMRFAPGASSMEEVSPLEPAERPSTARIILPTLART